MANQNRPVIGTVRCNRYGCKGIATVHQFAKGTRKNKFYTRCPECKTCDQSDGEQFQNYVAQNADFREGFEELAQNTPTTDDKEEGLTTGQDKPGVPDEETEEKKSGMGGVIFGGLALAGLVIGSMIGVRK